MGNTEQTMVTPGFTPQAEHDGLAALVGAWEGITRVWFEPEELADESPARGTFRPLLDGRFVIHEYEGSIQGTPLRGIAIHGYNRVEKKYETAWIDSVHTGTALMFSEGPARDGGFAVLGKYADPSGGPHWGWRTEVVMNGPDELVITAYNITPAGEEAKGVETTYTRKR